MPEYSVHKPRTHTQSHLSPLQKRPFTALTTRDNRGKNAGRQRENRPVWTHLAVLATRSTASAFPCRDDFRWYHVSIWLHFCFAFTCSCFVTRFEGEITSRVTSVTRSGPGVRKLLFRVVYCIAAWRLSWLYCSILSLNLEVSSCRMDVFLREHNPSLSL